MLQNFQKNQAEFMEESLNLQKVIYLILLFFYNVEHIFTDTLYQFIDTKHVCFILIQKILNKFSLNRPHWADSEKKRIKNTKKIEKNHKDLSKKKN